jgi:hypothetical protein
MDLNWGSHHLHISLAFLGGLALALVLFLTLGGPSVALETWLASGRQELTTTRALLQRDQQHAQQAQHARIVAGRLADSVSRLTLAFDSLRALGNGVLASAWTAEQFHAAATVLAQANQVCAAALLTCQHRGDSLALADALDQGRADSLAAAVQRLDSTLAQGLKVSQCHVLFVPCLSRTQMFEVGSIFGAVLVLLVRR